MNDFLPAESTKGNLQGGPMVHATNVDIARVSKEVEGQVMMAKKFPRDEQNAHTRLMNTCTRAKFAARAMYSFPRGGQKIEGPSIRLAEAAARAWGNLSYGVREIQRTRGESLVESFCWDLETNTRSNIEFTVKHVRDKKTGSVNLTSERDIYEAIANQGARRLRKCILSQIPEDVIEDAVEHCNKAMLGQIGDVVQRIKAMTEAFKDHGVTVEQLEKRIGNKLASCSPNQILALGKIFTSLKDGVGVVEDFFDVEASKTLKTIEAEMDPDVKPDPNFAEPKPTPEESQKKVKKAVDLTATKPEVEAKSKGKVTKVKTEIIGKHVDWMYLEDYFEAYPARLKDLGLKSIKELMNLPINNFDSIKKKCQGWGDNK